MPPDSTVITRSSSGPYTIVRCTISGNSGGGVNAIETCCYLMKALRELEKRINADKPAEAAPDGTPEEPAFPELATPPEIVP